MMRKLFIVLIVLILMNSIAAAETWRFDLNAGTDSISGGIHYKAYLDTGYLRMGGSGVYADEDSTEYRWASFDLTVGSDTLRPGLNIDVGLRSIFGDADDIGRSGDIGVVGFTVFADYLFDKEITFIPLEVFGGFTLAPEIMSFWDSEDFSEVKLGVGIRIMKNASIQFSYTNNRVNMKSGPGDWTLNENAYRAGIVMRF